MNTDWKIDELPHDPYSALPENDATNFGSATFSGTPSGTEGTGVTPLATEPETPERSIPDLTRFGVSDADNALRVHALAGGDFHHVAEAGHWIIWNGCRWVPNKDGGMVRLYLHTMEATARQGLELSNRKASEQIVSYAIRCRDAAKTANALTMLKAVKGVTTPASALDSDPWLLGTPSGMIDLKTGRAIHPKRTALITKSIACDLDPHATCPTWKRFIATVTGGDRELARFLQSWTGYTLTGSVREECLAFFHGTGANGKGTFTETIRTLLGDYAITAPESMFVRERHASATNDIARLAGCRMASAAELEEGSFLAESRIKAITARDAITARFLHKEFFDFLPTHKLWISGNHKPAVRGSDHGIWRRLRLVPFSVTIPKEERDMNLADKLRRELPGILNWALEGCLQWQQEGLVTPPCVTEATELYRAQEDVVGLFLEDCTEATDAARTAQKDLFERYQWWATEQGVRKQLSATTLNRRLEGRGLERIKVAGTRFWRGIKLLDD